MKAKTKAKTPSASKSGNRGKAKPAARKAGGQDAIAMLKADHAKVSGMFAKYEKLGGGAQKAKLAHEICKELIIHTELEEQIFYPACLEAGVEEDMMDEAQVEHDGAKVLIVELLGKPGGDEYYDAKVKVLSEYIKHHVKEEEQPGEGVFAQARKKDLDTAGLGEQMAAMKKELVGKFDAENLPQPEFKSFKEAAAGASKKSTGKPKNGNAERDDQPDPANDLSEKGEPRPWMAKLARAVR
jgi:hypothetical protein